MSHRTPPRERIQTAAFDLVEFALVAFEPEFLRWDKDVNLGVAEMIWNLYSAGMDVAVAPCTCTHEQLQVTPRLDVDDLVERLEHVRRSRWGHQLVMVLGLDVRAQGWELVFSFDLTWDDGQTLHPCEITWGQEAPQPEALN